MLRRKGVKLILRLCLLAVVLLVPTFFCGTTAYAAPPVKSDADQDHIEGNGTTGEVQDPDSPDDFQFTISSNAGATGLSAPLRILLVLTVLSIAPFILLMMTSFTRIIVVLHFVRTALGTQTAPPNQVLIGLALFLTLFIMSPVMSQVYTDAIEPFDAGEITQEEALERGMAPIREFMFEQTNRKDIRLFLEIQEKQDEVSVENIDDIPTTVLLPAFMISELRAAFIMGFLLYLPFIVIDMVVASTLMSMGMMMLPPTTISMPFKILLFVLADGWDLLIGQMVKTFY
ncbi:MAG: flagellar type III secretion system pore protein FliP [Eubacterium sp.]|nr:flagellar type III secretion system pore protein FliP [Eubacterium sp.]